MENCKHGYYYIEKIERKEPYTSVFNNSTTIQYIFHNWLITYCGKCGN